MLLTSIASRRSKTSSRLVTDIILSANKHTDTENRIFYYACQIWGQQTNKLDTHRPGVTITHGQNTCSCVLPRRNKCKIVPLLFIIPYPTLQFLPQVDWTVPKHKEPNCTLPVMYSKFTEQIFFLKLTLPSFAHLCVIISNNNLTKSTSIQLYVAAIWSHCKTKFLFMVSCRSGKPDILDVITSLSRF